MKKNIFARKAMSLCFAALLGAAAMSMMSCGAKKAQVEINAIEDLVGKKVGVQAGTTGELYVSEEMQGVSVKSFKTGVEAALDLKNGACDAVVLDELVAKEIVKRNKDLKIVNAPFATEEYAIAVRKGDAELLNSINKTIEKMKADGSYDALTAAFMSADGKITLPADIESAGSGVVKMGTNAAFPPFEYIEGVKVVGFDVTMAQYIARDLGKKLEVVDMNFDGLIAALQAGSIDFIAAGMTATDERRKNVDFSQAYYSTSQVIIVRK